MIKKANNQIQGQDQNISIVSIAIATLVLLLLFVFCYVSQYSLIIPALLFLVGIHLYLAKKADIKMYLNMGMLLMLIIFIAHVIDFYTDLPLYYIPVAGIAMLTMLLLNDLHLSLLMSITSSIIVTLILGGDFGMLLTFLLGSMVGSYTIRNARTRGQLFASGLFVGVIHLVCLFLLHHEIDVIMTGDFRDNYLIPLAVNGFISAIFLVLPTLKIFEYLFGVLTNFSLLELSDFNQPLLKRMILEAPGTYHHSLVVSNLAEAAADGVGANALLTRVGAYYHDIGKMVKSEYFTENQLVGGNKHDDIEPSMSRLVILNHVKEGIEIAKKYKLNPTIIEFIPQHHGTSLMYYFYQKALEDADEGEQVNEDDFRYPGPKPQSRETAITLLADSVEGATRALDDPNPSNIEDTVKKIVNNKFIDGQLDECNLTLKEIDKITEIFVRILSAMYHGRIKYPEKKTNSQKEKAEQLKKNGSKHGHQHSQSSEESSSESSSPTEGDKEDPQTL